MLEATGIVVAVPDPVNYRVAVLDVIPDWASNINEGQLYKPLTNLIGQEVYVLVIPKAEMLKVCQCGHLANEHFHFDNWEKNMDPNARLTSCTYFRWERHCDCQDFKSAGIYPEAHCRLTK